jgi:chloramphenicol-sensitive protein RarD
MNDNLPQPLEKERITGVLEGLGAYLWWGMVTTFYFRWVREATPLELLAWRVLAGLPVILLILSLRSELGKLGSIFRSPRSIGLLLCSALLIMGNWLTFIYSVVEARVSEASLGYYINPLVSVALGSIFLKEKLRPLQWSAVLVAAGGVGIFTVLEGSLPWISLVLAFSFALYGLIRKQVQASAEVGLAVEMFLLFIPMLCLQGYLTLQGTTVFLKSDEITLGLFLGGFVTVVPLWLFARAAKKLQLTTVGLMQYIAPTAQLMVAIFYIGEDPGTKWIPLALILVALAIYSGDSIRFHRRNTNGIS